MKIKLSKKLGPQAKKAAIVSAEDVMIAGHLLVSPNADVEAIIGSLKILHADIGPYNRETHQLSIHVPANRLNAVADLKGVVYLEAATKYHI